MHAKYLIGLCSNFTNGLCWHRDLRPQGRGEGPIPGQKQNHFRLRLRPCSIREVSLVCLQSLLHVIYSIKDGQGARILNGTKCINVRCMVGLSGKGTSGNGVKNLRREHLHQGKNGMGL